MASATERRPPGVPVTARSARPASQPLWKAVLLRAMAVALGLAPLLLCEAALRLAGVGRPTELNDPFVGFSAIHPLFVKNEAAGRYEIAQSRLTHFQPDSFLIDKPANEFRIFVLGGSTVQGRPWSIETSFTTWLELHLNAADPARRYEVVNCGGVSYASYRLLPMLVEVLQYQPDLIIFCEGHNEFLEDRAYAPLRAQGRLLTLLEETAARCHTYNVLRGAVLQAAASRPSSSGPARPVLGAEVDARLDWRGGLEEYHRDEVWRAGVLQHFEATLRRITRVACDHRVPLLFVSPVSNLQFAPFKSEHRPGLSASEAAQCAALLQQASALYATDLAAAAALLEQARQIDDQYAQTHYELGTCLLELGRFEEARAAFVQAKECDVCPLRMLEPMRDILRRVARETRTPLVDAHALIAAHSRSGFPDSQWLVDHVHPSISGHQLLADALADALVEHKWAARTPDWEARRDEANRAHLASLDHVYFQRGNDRLQSEQGWAHGLAPAVRPLKSPQRENQP
jgi:lysophospholipase L1-like esterase